MEALQTFNSPPVVSLNLGYPTKMSKGVGRLRDVVLRVP